MSIQDTCDTCFLTFRQRKLRFWPNGSLGWSLQRPSQRPRQMLDHFTCSFIEQKKAGHAVVVIRLESAAILAGVSISFKLISYHIPPHLAPPSHTLCKSACSFLLSSTNRLLGMVNHKKTKDHEISLELRAASSFFLTATGPQLALKPTVSFPA